jgi:Protein of unknown function (DUF3723)
LKETLEKIFLSAKVFKAKVNDLSILKLNRGVKLEYLHGQYRVLAAKEHLAASQWWWIVNIYGTSKYCLLLITYADRRLDLDKDTKQALREGYSYSAKYTSGKIFRHMRLCHYDKDALGV